MSTSRLMYGTHVHANGIRQHYLRYGGKGPAIVIIPGITSPAVTWGFVAERFATQFDTYVLDVRGRGLSSSSPQLDYGLDACARDVIEFALALGLKEYSIVGHSMGARIGIRASRIGAPGLSRLVLVDPPVSGPGRRRYPSRLAWYIDSIRQAQEGISIEQMRTFCPTWTNEQLRLRSEWLHTCDERAVVTTFDGFHQDDIHVDLPNVKVPTLLIVAGRGGVIEPVDEAEFSSLLSGLKIKHVPNAGHMIPWDDEEGFYAAFGDFLGRHIPTRHIPAPQT